MSAKSNLIEDWIPTRLEHIAKKKKNLCRRKFSKAEEAKEDEAWIESNKKILNDEMRTLRDKNLTLEEKKQQGWNLCLKEIKMWQVRKMEPLKKRKRNPDSPQGSRDAKSMAGTEEEGGDEEHDEKDQ